MPPTGVAPVTLAVTKLTVQYANVSCKNVGLSHDTLIRNDSLNKSRPQNLQYYMDLSA